MTVLFDHNVDRRFRRHLSGHTIRTAREMGWDEFENGELLLAAAVAGFDAILSVDKHIEFEQNLNRLPLPVVVPDCRSNALEELIPFASHLLQLFSSQLERALYRVSADGMVARLGGQNAG